MKQDTSNFMKFVKVNVDKQRWNKHKCRYECKQLIDKGSCDIELIWNPTSCQCECNKSCDVGEYLGYECCKCRKKLIDKSVEEYTENIDEVNFAKITLAEHENMCNVLAHSPLYYFQ